MANDLFKYWSDKHDERREGYFKTPTLELYDPQTATPLAGYNSLGGVGSGVSPDNEPISKFVGFDRILGANAGAAQDMAQGVSERVEKSAQDAKGKLGELTNQFNQQAKQGTLNYAGGLQNPIKQQTYKTTSNPRVSQKQDILIGTPSGVDHSAPPAQPEVNPADMTPEEYRKWVVSHELAPKATLVQQAPKSKPPTLAETQAAAAGGYTGKGSLLEMEGYDQVSKDLEAAKAQANQTTSQGGLQALLQDYYGKKHAYSQGAKAFDAALTGAAGGRRFEDLKKRYGGLDSLLGQGVKDSIARSDEAKRLSKDAAAKAQDELTKYDAEKKKVEQAEKDEASAMAKAERKRQIKARIDAIMSERSSARNVLAGPGNQLDKLKEMQAVNDELVRLQQEYNSL